MKFSEQWLREWVDPQLETGALCNQMTMAGLEVDAVETVAPPLDKVVVGNVISIESHPNADKLKVCQVDVGQAKPVSIVCGAANVTEQTRYPVAMLGAELPGGLKIKSAKLRGVESSGMLCSAKELSLTEQAEGLMPLADDAPVGEPIGDYLKLNDVSIELGLTPNRGDCLSVRGIAREVAVLNNIDVTLPDIGEVDASIQERFPIDIEAVDECPRYAGRIIKGINPKAPTPVWMQERLRRSGLRSLGPVVDVTNYVLLELGQPLHAFDLDKLIGGIKVRAAIEGEKIRLLDGQDIQLDSGTLVIADHKHAQAMAGIMGGASSAVSDITENIFLESAYFDPAGIAGRARQYGLRTDSSHRFERGVDPELQHIAINRATRLLLDIVGGEPGPVTDIKTDAFRTQRPEIKLRHDRIHKLLGISIEQSKVEEILKRLGMSVSAEKDGWSVAAPSFRFDIELEIDLIEEVARIYGYSEIPSSRAQDHTTMAAQPEAAIGLRTFQQVLVERGYQEAITYSFVDPALQSELFPQVTGISVSNPISADMSVMRISLLPGLVQAVRYNLNRQQDDIRLFETGLRFVEDGDHINQQAMLAGIACGNPVPEQWAYKSREVDFYDIKGDVEALLSAGRNAMQFSFVNDVHPALHPGQSARIMRTVGDSQKAVGWIGAIHPAIADRLDFARGVYVFELSLEVISQRHIPNYRAVSKFPAIRRDLAIVVDEAITAQEVVDKIWASTPEMLINIQLFDVYRGKGIASGRKSLAYTLTLQNMQCTLTDQAVEGVISEILSIINKELGATLRE